MILYTVLSPEEVLTGPVAEGQVVMWQGRRFLAVRLPEGGWRVERLLSTDPADFLRADWQPGRRLGSHQKG
ncbi:MAG: YlzJ-like family protein [Thermaerobacter sp.]|jgi:hypothetical protein|nr:YlzJ-like family protein [Thermaerobacter sp.]